MRGSGVISSNLRVPYAKISKDKPPNPPLHTLCVKENIGALSLNQAGARPSRLRCFLCTYISVLWLLAWPVLFSSCISHLRTSSVKWRLKMKAKSFPRKASWEVSGQLFICVCTVYDLESYRYCVQLYVKNKTNKKNSTLLLTGGVEAFLNAICVCAMYTVCVRVCVGKHQCCKDINVM